MTLTSNQMPAHTHSVALAASNGDPSTGDPTNGIPANSSASIYTDAGNATATMAPAQCSPAGGNQPHDNMPPYTAVNFIIALQGIFPPRQ